MLIKVSADTYINTDHVLKVEFYGKESAGIMLGNLQELTITAEAARYLLIRAEADEAFLTAAEIDAQPPASLSSRIAVLLREQFVFGATQRQIEAVLNLQDTEAQDPLVALMVEGVIISEVPDVGLPIFYHSSHAPQRVIECSLCKTIGHYAFDCPTLEVMPSPDLSTGAAMPLDAPAECTETTSSPKSDG